MNCTNHNGELPPLKARCNQLAVHIPSRNPTSVEIIPYVEARLADHQNHFAKNMDPSSGDHREWKSLNDDLVDFLKQLGATQPATCPPPPIGPIRPIGPVSPTSPENHQNNPPPKKSPRSDSTVANQQPTGESKVTPGDSKVNPNASKANPTDSAVTPGDAKTTSSDSSQPKTSTTNPPAPEPKTPAPPEPEKPFDIRDHLDAASMRVSYDLQEYLSGRSPLDKLTSPQQNVILLLLEDYTAERVAKVISQPEPYGFNLATSESAVIRFKKRFDRAHKKYIASLDDAALQQLLSKAHQSDEAFQTAVQRLIKTRLLNAANNPLTNPDTIDALATTLTKLRKQDLAERKQLHAEKTK
jgi:hypothetical protein